MNDTLIAERVKTLDPEYVKFLQGDFINAVSEQIATTIGFTEEQMDILNNGLTLYLLFFINLDELTAFIGRECEVSTEQADEITHVFVSCLPEGFTDNHHFIFNSITTEEIGLETEIAETEKIINNIPQVHTMQQDINLSHIPNNVIHSTTQDSLLRK